MCKCQLISGIIDHVVSHVLNFLQFEAFWLVWPVVVGMVALVCALVDISRKSRSR